MHGDIFRRVVPLVAFCQAKHANVKFHEVTLGLINVNIALTLTLFRWVSGEKPALHNVASGFFSTTVTINQQKIIIFI